MAETSEIKKLAGQAVATIIITSTLVLGAMVLWGSNINQRTDDANVIANYIGIAPEVNGRIIRLPVQDNQFVKKGDLLYEIDPLPYQYKLQQAISSRDNLDQQIIDERRRIQAQVMNAKAVAKGSESSTQSTESAREAAEAAKSQISQQEAVVKRTEAQRNLAFNNVARAEPLWKKQYFTTQQYDQLRTTARSADEELESARQALKEAVARYNQAVAQVKGSIAGEQQQQYKVQQSALQIDRMQTLMTERLAEESAVKSAAYDLERCRVYAPFSARVTNLSISVGQYATIGMRVFALIDTTAWWVLGNFKETQLHQIAPGMQADVFLMSRPDLRFHGVIESIGYGVSIPDNSGAQSGSLPSINRTLNWVRLAQRFPVRVRVLDPTPDLYRLGATATIVIRGAQRAIAIPADPNVSNTAVYGSPDGSAHSVN